MCISEGKEELKGRWFRVSDRELLGVIELGGLGLWCVCSKLHVFFLLYR